MIDKLKNNQIYILVFLVLMSIMNTCNSCSNKSELLRVKRSVDTLSSKIYTKRELDNKLEIDGLKTEKSVLLNTNQIFLTKERPDKRVMEIDQAINKLEKNK